MVSVNEALSGIFGSISLTAWICLLLPQLITNYKTQSADGLSMGFLAIWLFGDVTNLSGALVTQIAPTAVALAAYFCFSDVVLIGQCLYYKTRSARLAARERTQSTGTDASEDEPLLGRRRASSGAAPARRPSIRREGSFDPITRIVTGEGEGDSAGNPWLYNTLSLAAVYAVGTLGWFASYKMGAWNAPSSPDAPAPPAPQEASAIAGMILGYMSALCYLCARIPQIMKNYREKSCEGLALLFFLLSLTGNLTYGLSVFSYSQEPEYLIKTIPWLLGSLGTIVEDCIIFAQFHIYSPKRQTKSTGV